jgi:hypothetical protein
MQMTGLPPRRTRAEPVPGPLPAYHQSAHTSTPTMAGWLWLNPCLPSGSPGDRRPPGAATEMVRRPTVGDRGNEPATIYEIRVRGLLDPQWSSWFDGLAVEDAGQDETVIVGPVADQAALHGLLTRVRDLGLPLLAVRVMDGPRADGAQ